MAGVAQRNKFQGLFLFWGPAKQDFSKPDVKTNKFDCRRTRSQIDCHLSGLEGSQDHIKLFHVALLVMRRKRKSPRKNLFRGGIHDELDLV